MIALCLLLYTFTFQNRKFTQLVNESTQNYGYRLTSIFQKILRHSEIILFLYFTPTRPILCDIGVARAQLPLYRDTPFALLWM